MQLSALHICAGIYTGCVLRIDFWGEVRPGPNPTCTIFSVSLTTPNLFSSLSSDLPSKYKLKVQEARKIALKKRKKFLLLQSGMLHLVSCKHHDAHTLASTVFAVISSQPQEKVKKKSRLCFDEKNLFTDPAYPGILKRSLWSLVHM